MPIIHSGIRVQNIMWEVCLATLPGILMQFYFFGWGILLHILLAIFFALLAEACMLAIRQRPIFISLKDGSATITAILFAVCLPPFVAWWIVAIGIFFAIVVAKHLYGGLGMNPFNPAMVGYVVVLIAFPLALTAWVVPLPHEYNFSSSLHAIVTGQLPFSFDALSGATPLDNARTLLRQDQPLPSAINIPWMLINLAWLSGGLFLWLRRWITWHIPLGVLLGLLVPSSIAYLADAAHYNSPIIQLFSASTMIGAFFIATDPVSAPSALLTQFIFGVGIGLITFFIRTTGGYPDGLAFAVLCMNMLVPLLDRYIPHQLRSFKI